jgi:D-3-phosphoglycerate dehydrogenase
MPKTILLTCRLHGPSFSRLLADERVIQSDDLASPEVARGLPSIETMIIRSNLLVDEALLDRLPSLRLIIRAGSGMDNIDVAALRRRRIVLVRRPDTSAEAVAEIGTAALVLLLRKVPLAHAFTMYGRHGKAELMGDSLRESTVAVWGDGPVGSAVYQDLERRCASVSFVRHRHVKTARRYVDLATCAETADVHVLCLPLRPDTFRILDVDMIASMRDRRPYLINLGRFNLVDFGAAVQALTRNELRGIFVEPIDASDLRVAYPLLSSTGPLNVLTSQHVGAQRADVQANLADWVLQALPMAEEPLS